MLALPLLLVGVLPTIWIVDASNGPGTNFTDLPAAVAAAVSGDTILVRSGTYSVLNVTGKALTIRGAGAGTTMVSAFGQNIIQQVPAGSHCYVSGMTIAPPAPSLPAPQLLSAGLYISGSTTEVVLADVVVFGANALAMSSVFHATTGLVVSGGATVHAARCSFTGGTGNSSGGHSGNGAGVLPGCTLAADATTFVGPSSPVNFQFMNSGGSGLIVEGTATLSRSSASGGYGYVGGLGIGVGGFLRVTGTSANSLVGSPSVFGGYGLMVYGNGSAVVHGNITIGGGFTGPITFDPLPLPYLSVAGTTTPGGEFAPGQPVTITFDGGIPSAPFACIVDLAPGFSTALASVAVGELLLPFPTSVAVQGTLDAAGQFQSTLTPALAVPTLTGIPVYAQFGVYDAVAAKYRLSNGYIRIFE